MSHVLHRTNNILQYKTHFWKAIAIKVYTKSLNQHRFAVQLCTPWDFKTFQKYNIDKALSCFSYDIIIAWAKFIEIVLNRSITQPLASSREFSWRCSLSTLVVDSHRCCWLITFSSRPRVRNCLHFINLLNCQEDPNKPKLWVALWINCNRDSYFSEAGGYNCNTTHFTHRYWNRR